MFQEDSLANNILEITLAPSKRSVNQIDDHYDILYDNGTRYQVPYQYC